MNSSKKKKKICLIASSLGKGGAERATVNQAIIFKQLNFEVHVITINNNVSYKISANILNLGKIKDENKYGLGRIKSLLTLNSFLKAHNFDYVIDNRSRNNVFKEIIYRKFIFFKQKMIYVVHSFNKKIVFTSSKYIDELLYKNSYIIAVSKSIVEDIQLNYRFKNVKNIYNGFDFSELEIKSKEKDEELLADEYIIFYGRLDDKSKNLKLLLDAYSHSKLKENNVKLLVLGSGPDEEELINYSIEIGIRDGVIFKSFVTNPFPYVKNALFLVLSSRYEGFPMVIPEALSLQVPVISVDCKSGPNEVIQNEFNGLLIKNHDKIGLAKAMDRLYLDKELYLYCKKNAMASVAFLNVNNQLKVWKEYFENIDNNN